MRIKNIKIVVIVIAICLLGGLVGMLFFKNASVKKGKPISGGVTDNSFDAPKVINSSEITYFDTYFYWYNALDDDKGGRVYKYEITKKDDDSFILSEKEAYKIECPITKEELFALDKIIKNHKVARENGTDKCTAGLPPEFMPSYIKVEYESGEKIYVRKNNDPDSKFNAELVKFFKEIFLKNGKNEVLFQAETQKYKLIEGIYFDGANISFINNENSAMIKELIEKYNILEYVNWKSDSFAAKGKYLSLKLKSESDRDYFMYYTDDIPEGMYKCLERMGIK